MTFLGNVYLLAIICAQIRGAPPEKAEFGDYQSSQWPLDNLPERHHNHIESHGTDLFKKTKYCRDHQAWLPYR